MAVLGWFLSPIGRWVGMVLIVLTAVGVIYGKGAYDDHVAYTARIEREAQSAIQKGNAARDAATRQFDAGGVRDDGFSRD